MERLTNHFDYCDFIDCKYRNDRLKEKNQCEFFNVTSMDKCHDKAIYEKLRNYEDLEEQELLLKLPCRVGTPIYFICECFDYNTFEEYLSVVESTFDVSCFNFLGSTVFLTREEAEKKLAEMEKKEWD